MRFSDIPIHGFRIEVDPWALGQFVLERFQEKFGKEQILDVSSRKYPGEYNVRVKVKEKTVEIRDYSLELIDELQEKGVNGIVIAIPEDRYVKSKPAMEE